MPSSTVIPTLIYRDALLAIDFLERAFGFTRQAVYMEGPGQEGLVAHAQLTFPGGGMVMIGSAGKAGEWAQRVAQPHDLGGKVTAGFYLLVPDCAAAYERAKAANAEIVSDLRTMDYGGSAFACRDLEGHFWSFGDYDPWAL